MAIYDSEGMNIFHVPDRKPEKAVQSGILRQILGVEVHSGQLGKDLGGGQMTAMCKGLYLRGNCRVAGDVSPCYAFGLDNLRCQYVQLLYDWGVIVLIRLAVAPISP
jgi:hypothetical protein